MRVRPGLLVVLPLLLAVPAAAAVSSLTTGAAASAPVAAPLAADSALLVAAIAADSAVQRGAASQPSVATAAPRAVASKLAPKAEVPTVHAATRAVPRRQAAARTRTAAAAPASTSDAARAPRPSAAPTTKPSAQPEPAPSTAPVVTGRDDYPYRTATTNSYDEWGFTKRQCVSFAAWRLAQAGRPLDNGAEGWGSALTWDEVARQRGKAVSTRPVVGAVAHWNAGEGSAYYAPGSAKANGQFTAGGYGHVGWVTQVFADGSAQVEQYNSGGDRSWSSMRVVAPRYLRL